MAYPSLNFVLLPLMAPGHIIPMIDMAKLLAKRRLHVTIIVTHHDAARFASALDPGLSIRLLKVPFPCSAAGLPPGCESADLLPSYTLLPNFLAAINMLHKPVEELLTQLTPAPTCIISDKHITWTVETCNTFNIPRLVFDGMSCFTQIVTHFLYTSNVIDQARHQPFLVPCLPDKIELTKKQLPGLLNPGPTDVAGYREKVKQTEVLAYGMIVNTFHELESRYVEEFQNLERGKIWCVGPLSLINQTREGDHDHHCLRWLDSQRPKSVVYACLGSLSRLSTAQFVELALGLEESGHAFVLVVKGGEEMERWIVEDGIEERCRERGILVRGWVPQVAILSHSAVGAFLTHCGWNSTLEGICAGVPMVTWPLFAEQFLNEKLVVQIHEIGVGVGAKGVVHLGEGDWGSVSEDMVMRDGVGEAVRRVMDEREEEEGCERRERVTLLGQIAKRSVEEGGSSHLNITDLILDIANLVNKKSSDSVN